MKRKVKKKRKMFEKNNNKNSPSSIWIRYKGTSSSTHIFRHTISSSNSRKIVVSALSRFFASTWIHTNVKCYLIWAVTYMKWIQMSFPLHFYSFLCYFALLFILTDWKWNASIFLHELKVISTFWFVYTSWPCMNQSFGAHMHRYSRKGIERKIHWKSMRRTQLSFRGTHKIRNFSILIPEQNVHLDMKTTGIWIEVQRFNYK